ncbi:matrixin family metalloprotease, partial [Sulfitobacter sp.]|uniref:matrixin family metalloprotease n=1 Tax=Sulfitobacter sp. TaxID=1903071 RepID=UPI0035642891
EIAVAEPLEAEMEWPEVWTENAAREVVQHEPLDASADEDPDYGFGSTLVGTSVDLDSISPTGPPAQQGATVEVQSADDAHAPSAFSVSEIHDLTLGGANSGALNAISLKAEAQATFDAAVALWTGANGPVSANLDFVIGDLDAGTLASYDATANLITIDGDAAGAGWFVDASPLTSTEYATLNGYALEADGNGAAEGVDLLTVMLHEIGHAAGLDHTSGLALMGEALAEGERLLLPDDISVIPASLSGQLFYQVSASGAITAFSDASLTEQVFTTGSEVTTLIGLAGNTDALVGADDLFGGLSQEGTFKITGLNRGTLGFATGATTDYALTYSNIGLLRGGNDTDTALYVVEGENFDSVWDIASVNAGTVTSETGMIRFENIGKLVGGTESDAIIYATGGLLTHGFDDSNQSTAADATNVYEITVGDFVTLSLGDGASVSSSFVQNQTVTGFVIGGAEVTLNNVDVVTMTVTAATLFAGSDGETYFTRKANGEENAATGVEGLNFDFDLRFYRQAYTDGPLSGYHVWASLDASIDQLTLINADAIKGSVGQAAVLLNVASQGAMTGAGNITDAVVLREAPAFASATAEFASVTGTAALVFQEKSERAPGVFAYTDIAYFAGGLTLTKTTVDVELPSGDTVFGDLLVFQLADASAFIGTGMELPSVLIAPADVEFETANAKGVLATALNFALGLFKTQATDTVVSVI